jgi:hypothetical protein
LVEIRGQLAILLTAGSLAWYESSQSATEAPCRGIRYKAIDGEQPEWLALHQAPSIDAIATIGTSETEREVLSQLRTFTRSEYKLISSRTHPATQPTDLPSEFVYLSALDVAPAAEDAFNAWYHGEHTELFMRVPGWMRVRRYQLHTHHAFGTERQSVGAHRYLAIHEIKNAEFADTPEYAALLTTPQAVQMRQSLLGLEFRVFELCKT